MAMRVDSLNTTTATMITAVGCNSMEEPTIAAGITLATAATTISEHAQVRSNCFRSYFSY